MNWPPRWHTPAAPTDPAIAMRAIVAGRGKGHDHEDLNRSIHRREGRAG